MLLNSMSADADTSPPPATESNVFATLRGGGRIWALGAIRGQRARLRALHARLAAECKPGDQVIYLGDYLGHGPEVIETIDELLLFRRAFIARPGVGLDDIVYLRGIQEEMWQKLLQLQFAPNPAEVLRWMLSQGVGPSIAAYGGSIEEGLACARDGTLALTRWTAQLRQTMRQFDGHASLLTVLKHAAFTDDNLLLFCHAGLDPRRPPSGQGDAFWWGASAFATLAEPYFGFKLVVRGADHRQGGVAVGAHVVTLDSNAGRGGPLTAACFGSDGNILQLVEA